MRLADIKILNRMTLEEARGWLRENRYVQGKNVNGTEVWYLFFVGAKFPLHCVGFADDAWRDYANGLCDDGTDLVSFDLWDLEEFGIENPFACIKIWPRGEYEYLVNGHVYVWDGNAVNDFGEESKSNIQEAFAWIQDERYGDV